MNTNSSDESWDDRLDRITDRYLDKPVVVTEFRTKAVAGDRTLAGHRGSESYQAEFLADAVETFLDRDDVAGFTLWRFCDSLSADRFDRAPRATEYTGIPTGFR